LVSFSTGVYDNNDGLGCPTPMGYKKLTPNSRFLISDASFHPTRLQDACAGPELKLGSINFDEENEEVTRYLLGIRHILPEIGKIKNTNDN